MMIHVLLMASAMQPVFEAEVAKQAAFYRIPTPEVQIAYPTERATATSPYAWVGNCVPGFECDPIIFIRKDVVDQMGVATMKLLALHEVLHLVFKDHIGAKTEDQILQCHYRIWRIIDERLDRDTLDAFRVENKWWKERHR